MGNNKPKMDTLCVHAGSEPDELTGALTAPIVLATNFQQFEPNVNRGFKYSRTANPTRSRMEKCIAQLENGKYGLAFCSGMAAISTVLHLLKSGDNVLSSRQIYGGTYRYFTQILTKSCGIDTRFCDFNNIDSITDQIDCHSKLIWIETPTNPVLEIFDIKALTTFAHEHNLTVVVDNTFATPYLQNPLDYGVDIVVHSASKYINGHSDVIMGLVVTNSDDINQRLKFLQNAIGTIPSPFDCYMALRGVKTLHLRVERQCQNAQKVAEFLKGHPKVVTVHYPGLKSHYNHDLATSQMKKYGSVVSFEIMGGATETQLFLKALKIFVLAESLGAVESLANYSAIMTHSILSPETRKRLNITDSLVRLSIGIESSEDLIDDLRQSLLVI